MEFACATLSSMRVLVVLAFSGRCVMAVQASQTCPIAFKGHKLRFLCGVLKDAGAGWVRDNAMRLSAALALYTILSLAPLLVITIKIVTVVWRYQPGRARGDIGEQMTNLMGTAAAGALREMLEKGSAAGSGILATTITSIVLIFSATGVFIELQDSMNVIWGVEPKPNQGIWGFVRNRLLSLAMVFGIAFLLLVSMFISTTLTTLAQKIAGNCAWLALLCDIVVSLGFITLLFAAIFKFLPDVVLKWKHVWMGAIITSVLFMLGKYGLALYFKYGTAVSAFGAAGSLAAVLLWVYYSGFILFFGAEFTKAWVLHQGDRVVPEEIAEKVTVQHGDVPSPVEDSVFTDRRWPDTFRREQRQHDAPYPGVEENGKSRRARFGGAAYTAIAGAFAGGIGTGWMLWNRSRTLPDPDKAAKVKSRLDAMQAKLRQVSGKW